ncbi:bile acid:sodium symporter family protein [Mycolicibacterium aubagnense]|uniref:Transporter n=1 Tax=Mycolicibacterium aubagnense TaxID=319707 RepID=A0ABM7IHZ2_9MYCO|nr:bile acid:sodium symporter [Mycolicibacterium aubagnense]TLH67795.1 transporter [Mycolicibacterium aubagnense]WGI32070.1 bile acid:sodium symporter [Mycolicibacterium aubagnense]BBX86404.1 transporter [Mycolicibacterium aubagnense]
MTLSDLAARGSNIAVVLFVVSSTLGVGLSLTPAQILAPLKDVRVVSLALVANFVAAPMVAFGLWRLLALDEPLGIGLLLCGLAAGAPFLIKLAEFAKADTGLTVGVMALLMITTVAYVPIVLPIFLKGSEVNPLAIASSLVILMLIPLAIGLLWRKQAAETAARVRPAVGLLSTVSMVLVVVLTIVANFREVLSVYGTRGILAAIVYTAICAGIGWALVFFSATARPVLALGTAQRNAAAAFVVAGQNFDDPRVTVMITVVLIAEFTMLIPFARFLARRA